MEAYKLPKASLNIKALFNIIGYSLVAQTVKNLPAIQEIWIQSLGQEDPQEEGMAIHSSYSCQENCMDRGAWRATVPGWQRVGHD